MMTGLEFDEQIATSTTNLSINRLARARSDRELELRPPFQRNLVWNAEQKSYLVDSVLRGMPIPELYIQTAVDAKGAEKTIVVDGQQRISTCIAFLEDDLRLTDDRELDSRWRGRTFSELPTDDLRRRFRSYELIARTLPASLSDRILREIFRRLNKTVEPLTPQEIRHAAFSGPFIQIVEHAAAHPVLNDVGVFSSRDYLRRRSDEFVAELALAVVSGAFPNKKNGLDDLFFTYEIQGFPRPQREQLVRRFGRVFTQLEPMAEDLRKTRFRNKSDFYSMFCLLATKAEHLPLAEQSTNRVVETLSQFSDSVNEARTRIDDLRSRGEEAVQADPAPVRYLLAVDRAATDRLNRVRRNEALEDVIGASLNSGRMRPLERSDEDWMSEISEDEDEWKDVDESDEKTSLQQRLMTAP